MPDAKAVSLSCLGYSGGSSLFGWCPGLVLAGIGWMGLVSAVRLMCAVATSGALLSLRPTHPPAGALNTRLTSCPAMGGGRIGGLPG